MYDLLLIGLKYSFSKVFNEGMVVSEHPIASKAGVQVLKAGGNAMDAAIAVNSVLNVVEPASCGIGGDIFFLIYTKDEGKVKFLNGSGRASSNATIEFYENKGYSSIPTHGSLASITVPGCVNGWNRILEEYGSMKLDQLLKPAILCADRGFPISNALSNWINEANNINVVTNGWKRIFCLDGLGVEAGDILVQKDLARTLRIISDEGCEEFYQGVIAEEIVNYVEKCGGILSLKDFQQHCSNWDDPVTTNYREYQIYETAPNSQALTVLIALNILEGYDLKSLSFQSASYLHLMIEASKLAYLDRDNHIGDPNFMEIPMKKLISKDYASMRRKLINNESSYIDSKVNSNDLLFRNGDTTYFAIVDKDRNCVSCIQSLYGSFGCHMVVPGTGIVLQNRGSYFSLNKNHHNRVEPGKRTLHTLCASITFKEFEPMLLFGSMGGDIQPQIHQQVFSSIFDYGMNIQKAIGVPRWSIPKSIYSNEQTIFMEERFGEKTFENLKNKGHKIKCIPNYSSLSGHAHGLEIREEGMIGGADPRGDGVSMGY